FIIDCIVCAIGLIGNTLSFLVLHKSTGGNVGTYLLEALTLTDNLLLAIVVCNDAYYIISVYSNLSAQCCIAFQTYVVPLRHITNMCTVWMIAIVAGNRYIAVCRPMDAPRLCTKYNVQLEILIMAGTVCVYNIPRFFKVRIVVHNVTRVDHNNIKLRLEEPEKVGIASIYLYNILYLNVCYVLFVFILPLAIIIYFNVHLMRGLKVAQSRRSTMSSHSINDQNNITLVMIVITVAFVVCQTPASINHILHYVIGFVPMSTCIPYIIYFKTSNLFVMIKSSLNFLIYCLFRKQFQHKLFKLFGRTCGRPASKK
ncbi:hypothetical protein LSAT2_026554, partial [Lamellibrachia satsuma]